MKARIFTDEETGVRWVLVQLSVGERPALNGENSTPALEAVLVDLVERIEALEKETREMCGSCHYANRMSDGKFVTECSIHPRVTK